MITALPFVPQVGPFSMIKWARFRLKQPACIASRPASLGHEPPFGSSRMVARIRTALLDLQLTKRRLAVVTLDEAHLLTQPMLEQLRLLLSDKMDSESLATLVLVGPPSLRQTLHLSVNEALTAAGRPFASQPARLGRNHRLCASPGQDRRLQRQHALY